MLEAVLAERRDCLDEDRSVAFRFKRGCSGDGVRALSYSAFFGGHEFLARQRLSITFANVGFATIGSKDSQVGNGYSVERLAIVMFKVFHRRHDERPRNVNGVFTAGRSNQKADGSVLGAGNVGQVALAAMFAYRSAAHICIARFKSWFAFRSNVLRRRGSKIKPCQVNASPRSMSFLPMF